MINVKSQGLTYCETNANKHGPHYPCSCPANTWCHVASTWHPANGLNMYLNAQLIGSSSSTVAVTPSSQDENVYLGQKGGSAYLDGYLDEVVIWESEKSASFILAWYEAY